MVRISWQRLKPILVQALGYFFLVLGVLGMFLPILQGFLFLFIGLIILARHAPWAERLLDRFRRQSPKFDAMISKAETKTHLWRIQAEAQSRFWWRRARTTMRLWWDRTGALWGRLVRSVR
ncbi:MAG TPA: PGPGW domain-containing protein [Geminicoccaceae bacterium]|nr:PGPGW domain-containing protein [Geminicoccaceae bacterium]